MAKSLVERVAALETDMENTKRTIDRLMEVNDEQLAKIDKLTKLVYIGMGGIMVIQALAAILIPLLHK